MGSKRVELIPANKPATIAMETHHYSAGQLGSCLRDAEPAARPKVNYWSQGRIPGGK